jgi:hypothetical protein
LNDDRVDLFAVDLEIIEPEPNGLVCGRGTSLGAWLSEEPDAGNYGDYEGGD